MTRRSISSNRVAAAPQYERTPQEIVAERMMGLKREVASRDDLEFFHNLILGWQKSNESTEGTVVAVFNKVARRKELDIKLLKVAAKVCSSEGTRLELGPVLARVYLGDVEVSPKHLARIAMIDFGLNPSVPEEERFERMATIIGSVEDKSKILGSN